MVASKSKVMFLCALILLSFVFFTFGTSFEVKEKPTVASTETVNLAPLPPPQPAASTNFQIYKVYDNWIDKDVKYGNNRGFSRTVITVWNNHSINKTISNVSDYYTQPNIVSALNSSVPAGAILTGTQLVSWIGTYTVTAYDYYEFIYDWYSDTENSGAVNATNVLTSIIGTTNQNKLYAGINKGDAGGTNAAHALSQFSADNGTSFGFNHRGINTSQTVDLEFRILSCESQSGKIKQDVNPPQVRIEIPPGWNLTSAPGWTQNPSPCSTTLNGCVLTRNGTGEEFKDFQASIAQCLGSDQAGYAWTPTDWQFTAIAPPSTAGNPFVFNTTAIYEDDQGKTHRTVGEHLIVLAGDTVAPDVKIIDPKNKTYNKQNLTLKTQIGPDVQSCWYSLNGGLNTTFTCGNDVNFTANNGPNNIFVFANDSYSNIGNDSVFFKVDTSISLDISIIFPANNTFADDTTPQIKLLAIDYAASQINYTMYIYFANGTLYSVGNTGVLNNNTVSSFELNPALILVSGNPTMYYVIAAANDTIPNFANSSKVFITLQDPHMDLISPYVNYWDNDGNINFVFRYFSINHPTANCSLYLNGAYNQSNATTQNYTSTTFSVTGIADGANQNWTVKCAMNGVQMQDSRIFNVDKTPPQISFVPPTTAAGSYNQNWIAANVTATDPLSGLSKITTYLYNTTGLVYSNLSGTSPFFINFTSLPDGTYYLNATAHDIAGNINSTGTNTIILDTTNPQIQFVPPTPPSNTLTKLNTFSVNVTIVDQNFVSTSVFLYNTTNLLSINTGFVNPYLVNYGPLADGIYFFNATAIDLFGLTNKTETRNITIDTKPPIITGEQAINITQNSANIIWTTDVLSNSTVEYGTTTTLGSNATNATNTLSHFVPLAGLNSSTLYFFNVTSCDLAGNCNTTGSFNFTTLSILDVNISQPPGQIILNSTNATYLLTITNNGTIIDSYNLSLVNYHGANVAVLNQTALPNLAVGASRNVLLTVGDPVVGNYTVNVTVVSSTNATITDSVNITTRIISGAFILNGYVWPAYLGNGSNAKIYVSAIGSQSEWAVITKPDSNTETVMLTNNANTTFSNTSLIGIYNVTIFANDSSGKVVNTTDQFETYVLLTFNVTVVDYNITGLNSTWFAYFQNETIAFNSSAIGQYSEGLFSQLLDFEFRAYNNRLIVTVRQVNASIFNGRTFGMDRRATPSTGFLGLVPTSYLATYSVNDSYNFTTGTIRIYYDNLIYVNENNLMFYTCANWNFIIQTCVGGWTDISALSTKDTTNDYFEYNTNTFSGFTVLEDLSGGGGGGGSGGSGGSPPGDGDVVDQLNLTVDVDAPTFINEGEGMNVTVNITTGLRTSVNVSLNYTVVDEEGNILYEETEELTVNEQLTHEKELDTSDLGGGEYEVVVRAVSHEQYSSSRDSFMVFGRYISRYCGDGRCSWFEDCESCTQDCGECPVIVVPAEFPTCALFSYDLGKYFLCWFWWILAGIILAIIALLDLRWIWIDRKQMTPGRGRMHTSYHKAMRSHRRKERVRKVKHHAKKVPKKVHHQAKKAHRAVKDRMYKKKWGANR